MAVLREDWFKGAKVLWDRHPRGWVDAWGSSVTKIVNPFVVETTDTILGHTVTLVEAGSGESTVAYSNVNGGGLLITTDANENDGLALQDNNYAFTLSTYVKRLYFGCRMKMSEATQSDFFLGISVADTTPLGGVEDGIYFKKADGTTAITFNSSKDTTDTSVTVTPVLAADTYAIYEFIVDNELQVIYGLIDGAPVATLRYSDAAYNTDEAMSFNFQLLAGSANARTATIAWRRIIMVGGLDGETS